MRPMSFLLVLAGCGISAMASRTTVPSPEPAVKAVLVLDGALSSKDAAGKEFKLLLDKPVKLPDGRLLRRETPFHGVVLQSAAHSKKLPNGTLVLKIDEARPKNEAPIPLTVTVEDVGQSFDDDDAPPAKKGDKKNADAGAAKPAADAKAQGQAPQFKRTELDGVFLALSPQGPAILVAPGAELYLDNPTALSVTITEPAAKAP